MHLSAYVEVVEDKPVIVQSRRFEWQAPNLVDQLRIKIDHG